MFTKIIKLRAKWKLYFHYKYINEVNKILEKFITEKILGGGSATFLEKGRAELISKQNEIAETDKLIAFLKKI